MHTVNFSKNLLRYILIGVILFSCSKMDDYRSKFMSDGPIPYSGKIDSLKIISGRNRAQIIGLAPSDPNVVSYKIFWNDKKDSLTGEINPQHGDDTIRIDIDNLPEGDMNFEIRSYDNLGNSSVPEFLQGRIYGDDYQRSLLNRGIEEASIVDDGSASIEWQDINESIIILQMEIKYTNEDDILIDTIIKAENKDQVTLLPEYKVGSLFSYNTSFLPEKESLDTFHTNFDAHSVRSDVTKLFLSNTGPGFIAEPGAGRWGTLAAPWITNAAAKNKDGGTHGGYTSDSRWGHNGQINWETWGQTPVIDGKVYQVSSARLPAGNYTVTFRDYSEIQSNSSVYCIVALGTEGIPSLSDIDQSLGYTMLFNGANVGATSPNTEEIKSFDFQLDQPEYISIGFLGNLRGDGDPGNYFVVGYINLIQN